MKKDLKLQQLIQKNKKKETDLDKRISAKKISNKLLKKMIIKNLNKKLKVKLIRLKKRQKQMSQVIAVMLKLTLKNKRVQLKAN